MYSTEKFTLFDATSVVVDTDEKSSPSAERINEIVSACKKERSIMFKIRGFIYMSPQTQEIRPFSAI